MRQYFNAKAQTPGCVLLFRMGDFWETFYEDAQTASRVLEITLTQRGLEKGEPIPLAGVPLSQLEPSVAKLVAAGHKVAICDQVEDAKLAKGLVRREVVEIVSAGTATMPGLLDERVSRWLVAIFPDAEAGRVGVARCEVTTGELVGSEVTESALADELDRVQPSEILVPDGKLPAELARAVKREAPVERLAASAFLPAEEARQRLEAGPGLDGGVTAAAPLALTAAAALVAYLGDLRKAEAGQLAPFRVDEGEAHLVLDEISLRNLEILRPLREAAGAMTLRDAVDRTRTPMGGRLLREWLARPLLDPARIGARHDAVEELAGDGGLREQLSGVLDRVADMARIAMRIATGRAHARDLVGLANSLEELPRVRELLSARAPAELRALADALSDFAPEVETIRETLADAPPLAVTDGGVIRAGFHAELDRLRGLSRSGKDWIAELQAKERKRTGIDKLKVGYNRVFGYYLEVSKAHKDRVPAEWDRRQTLVNAERYVTPELKEREAEILGADEKAKTLEYELFGELRARLGTAVGRIRSAAGAIAALDVLLGFAETALRAGWTRPAVDSGDVLDIKGGRHPVVEASLPAHQFVPNDTLLDGTARQIALITGPNMAGKSTYLRQVALIVILAQTGSFVPAEAARIGVVDRIFTRVGASDFVAAGHSTFMVEMVEVSRILAAATPRSLVLLDEVGRGTSTYDGLAIAWSVMEHLHERPERAARTLFATHYHELTELADNLTRAVNLRVTVHEHKDRVVFLRKVVEGAADRSFGIQVAQLAGLPREVTRRARKILQGLEEGTFLQGRAVVRASGSQMDLFSGSGAGVLAELGALDPDALTPMEALAVLAEWKRRTGGDAAAGDDDAAPEDGRVPPAARARAGDADAEADS
jgi:DNA mismatch repair protein MutS